MSRCFPFPPPGYEKKATADTVESLTKESQKEKSDKKDKRNREQRDGKERKHKKHKDKDRVKEKHGDRKDRKAKDKKKDKEKKEDKDKSKDRDRTQNQKTFEEHTRKHQAEKHGENTQNLSTSKESVKDSVIKYGAGMPVAENSVDKSLARDVGASGMSEKGSGIVSKTDRNVIIREKRSDISHMLAEGANGTNTFSNSAVVDQRKHVSTSREVERATSTRSDREFGEMDKIWVDGAVDGNMSSNLINSEHRSGTSTIRMDDERRPDTKRNPPAASSSRSWAMDNLLGKVGAHRVAEKGRETDSRTERDTLISEREIRTMGDLLVEGMSANNAANFISTKQEIYGGNSLPEKDANKRIHEKERSEREPHKDKNREKKKKDKDRDGKKEKKKEKDKIRETTEQKQQKPIDESGDMGVLNIQHLLPLEGTDNYAGFDGNSKKRSINGFLHEDDLLPNKMSRTASFSHLPVENGRKLDILHIARQCTSGRQEGKNNMLGSVSVDKGQQKTNGIVNSHTLEVALETKALEANSVGEVSTKALEANSVGEVSKKPHPDEKYLSQILSVPKMEELLTVDDEEWLFDSHDDIRQKPRTATMTAETREVWSGALRIGESDILALPYVIPY